MKKTISIFLCFFIIFSFVSCSESKENFSALSSSDRNYDLYDMAQKAVKVNLKAPSTAKFPDVSEAQISDLGNDEYEVQSYVDAENSFSAMIRSNFDIKIKVQDKENDDNTYTYNIESCNIN